MADLIIKNLTSAQLQALTRALTEAGVDHTTSQMFFTTDEAQALLEELGDRQRQLVELVAHWDGVLPDEELRSFDGPLRGITGPITKAVDRLAKQGRIRPGLGSPVQPVYDPNNRSFQRVRAYKMDEPNVVAFKAVASPAALPRRGGSAGGAV